jgi:hypothetical protein
MQVAITRHMDSVPGQRRKPTYQSDTNAHASEVVVSCEDFEALQVSATDACEHLQEVIAMLAKVIGRARDRPDKQQCYMVSKLITCLDNILEAREQSPTRPSLLWACQCLGPGHDQVCQWSAATYW